MKGVYYLAAIAVVVIGGAVGVEIGGRLGPRGWLSIPLGIFVGSLAAWPLVNKASPKPSPFLEWALTNAVGWTLMGALMYFDDAFH